MIAIIDVSGNNLTSLTNAIERLKVDFVLTHEARVVEQASHVILPGVGTAVSGMNALISHGLVDVLKNLRQPVLGICLGMQLLLEYSEEGEVECLGVIPGRAQFLKASKNHPVPHMGWNRLSWCLPSPMQQNVKPDDYVYFVHGFALKTTEYALASCTYDEKFSAIVQNNNFYGMQFHPEKSAAVGMNLLKNFCELEA